MAKAEKFIQDYTNHCSNEIEGGGYHEWLTPEQARAAVEIAKEEMLKEEPVSKELEEAAYQFANCFKNQFEMASMAFIKGAKWQKELLMKEAIPGMVSVKTNYNILMCDRLAVVNAIKNYNEGDKVKVIIIKED